MEIKRKYERVVITQVGFDSSSPILSGSVPIDMGDNLTVIIPHGQKVDEYDFSDSHTEFAHNWEITEPTP